MTKSNILAGAALVMMGLCAGTAAQARDQIRVVGSSTVYPFTTAVAEQFGKRTGTKTPVVESTGTGGGMKLFCAGVGDDFPDATNASRRIKLGEFESCQKNGVNDIVEIKIGYDGLTLAHSKSGPDMKLTRTQLFLALAKQVPGPDGKLVANPNKTWKDVDASLPNEKIEVLGPPPTSGTRDSLHELFMEAGALAIPSLAELKKTDAKAFETVWKSVREDGAYVEAGENDNVIVQKLAANPDAYGIFGYSFLEENVGTLKGVAIDGVVPTFETISDGSYKPSRELFVYIKKAHIGVIPGLGDFAKEYVSARAIGDEGYLADKGLVPLPAEKLKQSVEEVNTLAPLTAQGLSN